jgi:hypothetical protein
MNKSKLFRLFAFLIAVSMVLPACGAAQLTAAPGDATGMFDQVWTEAKGGQ